jgi:hypothetical protein
VDHQVNKHGVINPIPGFHITIWDMGLDVTGPEDSAPIFAPAHLHIVDYVPDFYEGQPLVLYKFYRTPQGAASPYIYFSEAFRPFTVERGRAFKQGHVLGRYRAGLSNNMECGWGDPNASSRRLAQARGWPDQHFGSRPPGSPFGNSFQDFFSIP